MTPEVPNAASNAPPIGVNPPTSVEEVPSGFQTVTSAVVSVALTRFGELAVMIVPPVTSGSVAATPPMVTVAPVRNPVPVSVSATPPVLTPWMGLMESSVGGGPT
jgi:hypothetical protein